MALEHVDRFVTLSFAGTGLLFAGGVNLLVSGGRVWLRTTLTLLVGGLTVAAVAVWSENNPTVTGRVAAVFALLVLPSLLEGKGVRALGRVIGTVFGRPAVRWGAVAAVGLVLVTGSAAVYEIEDQAWAELDTADTLSGVSLTSHVEAKNVLAATDQGTAIPITQSYSTQGDHDINERALSVLSKSGHAHHIIHRQPASDICNCHGWVFTDGRYGLNGDAVETIIAENGYQPVSTPRPGDLVIYRHEDGRMSHSAIVRYVTDGMPVMVEGKWGWMGVYLHAVDQSIYGTDFTYYRSPRGGGHVLRFSSQDPTATSPVP